MYIHVLHLALKIKNKKNKKKIKLNPINHTNKTYVQSNTEFCAFKKTNVNDILFKDSQILVSLSDIRKYTKMSF